MWRDFLKICGIAPGFSEPARPVIQMPTPPAGAEVSGESSFTVVASEEVAGVHRLIPSLDGNGCKSALCYFKDEAIELPLSARFPVRLLVQQSAVPLPLADGEARALLEGVCDFGSPVGRERFEIDYGQTQARVERTWSSPEADGDVFFFGDLPKALTYHGIAEMLRRAYRRKAAAQAYYVSVSQGGDAIHTLRVRAEFEGLRGFSIAFAADRIGPEAIGFFKALTQRALHEFRIGEMQRARTVEVADDAEEESLGEFEEFDESEGE